MLIRIPLLIPQRRGLIQATHQESLPEVSPPLAVWVISGNTTRIATFQRDLRSSSWHHGDKNPPTRVISWCSEQDSDPISGPIGEVVDFSMLRTISTNPSIPTELTHIRDSSHMSAHVYMYTYGLTHLHKYLWM